MLAAKWFDMVIGVDIHIVMVPVPPAPPIPTPLPHPFVGLIFDPAGLGVGTAMSAGISAALGGTLIGMTFSFLPASGLAWLLKGIVVVVLGGMGSIVGTLVGGIILGPLKGSVRRLWVPATVI